MRYPGIFLLAVLVGGCAGFVRQDPKVTFVDNNALLPNVQFETGDEERVSVEYWPTGQPDVRQTSNVSAGKNHSITLVNLAERTSYNFWVIRADSSRKSRMYTFVTGEVPEQAFKPSLEKIDTTLFNGYILVRRLSGSGADAILNNKGAVVWYHLYDKPVRRAFSWTDHQSILSTYDSAEIVEVDLMGNRVLDLDLEKLNIPNKLHHEIAYTPRSEIATLTLDSTVMDLRKLGGTKNQMLRADGLVVIDKQGKKVWEWNLLQQTNPLIFDGGPFKLNESWGHANSFAVDEDGNYLISFRDFNQIWKINAVDGSVIWKFGKGGDFEMDPDSYFIKQHSVHFNKKGELMIFDNGSADKRPNSRVLCFKLDEKNRKAETTVKVKLPLELSGYRMCSAEYIADGKYLVCITRRGGVVAVVNDAGEILWKVILKAPSYRAYYLESPFHQAPI